MEMSSVNFKHNLADLLEKWRDGKLTSDENLELWVCVQDFIGKNTSRHYKNSKQGKGYSYESGGCKHIYDKPLNYRVSNNALYDAHQLRVLWFFDFVEENTHKTTKWCMDAWKRRTSWIEMLVEANSHGFSLYSEDLPITTRINKTKTRRLVEIKSFVKKHGLYYADFSKIYEAYRNEYPSKSEKSCRKIIDEYVRYVLAKSPELQDPRETRNQPKRTYKSWG